MEKIFKQGEKNGLIRSEFAIIAAILRIARFLRDGLIFEIFYLSF